MKKRKTIDISQYRYYPEDKQKLELDEIIFFIRYNAKHRSERNRIIKNVNTYLSGVGEDFLEQVQVDLYKGLPFMKKHNLVISDNYIIGSIKELGLDPIVIPKEQIREIAYKIYNHMFYIKGLHRGLKQEFYFRLKNGKEIKVHVNDKFYPELALRALQACGIKMIDISPE